MKHRKLYIFQISHYCEKGRWALDFHDLDYQLELLAPGEHSRWANQMGLAASSLPVLDTGSELVQGSGAIIDWADEHSNNGRTLTPEGHREECMALEARLDEPSGVHLRRMFYSASLISDPGRVYANMSRHLSGFKALKFKLMWPVIRRVMISKMDIGPEQGLESQAILNEELQWLDGLYKDGRRFLVADRFTRADLTAASLFARLASPSQHPYAEYLSLPDGLVDYVNQWQGSTAVARIRENYREFR